MQITIQTNAHIAFKKKHESLLHSCFIVLIDKRKQTTFYAEP